MVRTQSKTKPHIHHNDIMTDETVATIETSEIAETEMTNKKARL